MIGATVLDGQGQGTIQNDDAALPDLTVNDVSASEGNSGSSNFAFTVSLSAPAGAGGVTFDIATAKGQRKMMLRQLKTMTMLRSR